MIVFSFDSDFVVEISENRISGGKRFVDLLGQTRRRGPSI